MAAQTRKEEVTNAGPVQLSNYWDTKSLSAAYDIEQSKTVNKNTVEGTKQTVNEHVTNVHDKSK
jgi:hypothetical protein